jgi:hypothetical protein
VFFLHHSFGRELIPHARKVLIVGITMPGGASATKSKDWFISQETRYQRGREAEHVFDDAPMPSDQRIFVKEDPHSSGVK